jgi:hypothetical protein
MSAPFHSRWLDALRQQKEPFGTFDTALNQRFPEIDQEEEEEEEEEEKAKNLPTHGGVSGNVPEYGVPKVPKGPEVGLCLNSSPVHVPEKFWCSVESCLQIVAPGNSCPVHGVAS